LDPALPHPEAPDERSPAAHFAQPSFIQRHPIPLSLRQTICDRLL